MKLHALTTYLKGRLKQEMPGEAAHSLMKPSLKNGDPIRIKHNEPPREGGVLILLYEENGDIKFPLIQRSEYEGIHSGQIAFPGGKKDDADKDLVETALREAEEEIGIKKEEVTVIGCLSKFFITASNFDILPVVGFLERFPEFEPDEREVNGIITPMVMDVVDEQRIKTKNIVIKRGFELKSPYFDLEGQVIWGATAMMLNELAVIIKEFNPRL